MIHKLLSNNTAMILIAGAIIVLVSVLMLNFVFQSTMDGIEWREEIYHVREGDNLWRISREYCPNEVDRREWVEEIKTLNDLPDSMLHVGQKLIVLTPVK